MSDFAIGISAIGVMLMGLFVLRIPAGFIMGIVGFAGIIIVRGWTAATFIVGSEFWKMFSKFGFTIIPMFILLGEFIYYSGISGRLFQATYKWFGRQRGGLAVSTIVASAGFSAICGSNTATAATMSAVAIPAMTKFKYHPILKAGSVAAGATLGVMIPPSIVLVVYGLNTGQSIGKLFVGTLIPSAILTIMMVIATGVICRLRPEWGPRGEKTTLLEKIKVIPSILEIPILFGVIMAALLSGMVTATEAAPLSCFLGLAICLIRRKLSWKRFVGAIHDTLRVACMIFMIVTGAMIFGRLMTATGVPNIVAEWIAGVGWPNWMILTLVILFYIIGGCLMDALAFLLASLPIFFPIVVGTMHFDPIWFGVLICLVTTLGAITPPIGICCYVISGMSKEISIKQVFKGALCYVPAYVITIIIMIVFGEWTVNFLANLVR